MMRPLVAVVGDTRLEKGGEKWSLAVALGHRLIDEGYRIVTGGVGDLPIAIAEGARKSPAYGEGLLVSIVPGFDPSGSQGASDIAVATGLDFGRNLLMANCDAVVALGGGSGTLSEIALAWGLKRLVLAYRVSGWSGKLAGIRIDDRVRYPEIPEDQVYPVASDEDVARLLKEYMPRYSRRHRGIPQMTQEVPR